MNERVFSLGATSYDPKAPRSISCLPVGTHRGGDLFGILLPGTFFLFASAPTEDLQVLGAGTGIGVHVWGRVAYYHHKGMSSNADP